VPMWCVAPLEMNEGNSLGQGYNRPTGCSAENAPHATFKFNFNSNYGGHQGLILLFQIPMGRRKNLFEIYRQFWSSQRLASPGLEILLCKTSSLPVGLHPASEPNDTDGYVSDRVKGPVIQLAAQH